MASFPDNVSMAVFCDFENVALGVRDANYDKFDIKPVLERLLLKGSIVVKKAYCDWERYKSFKSIMHEANFELIEIPHVRQSGKNSADIRMVVDALDLCYTKSHVNTFVIISGDSDFSPLVSKLRENAKMVIGVGVKQSTSDLLVANCDEFIFYDDLVRESRRSAARREPRGAQQASRRTPEEEGKRKDDREARKTEAIDMAMETFEALVSERADGKVWASLLKDAIKRRKPGFSETYYGFRTFGNLLEEAQARGLLEFGRDEKSGAYAYRSSNPAPMAEPVPQAADAVAENAEAQEAAAEGAPQRESRRGGRGGRGRNRTDRKAEHHEDQAEAMPVEVTSAATAMDAAATPSEADNASDGETATARKPRGTRKPAASRAKKAAPAGEAEAKPAKAPAATKKPAARSRSPRKPKAAE